MPDRSLRRARRAVLLSFAILLAARPAAAQGAMADDARAYLSAALDSLQATSRHRATAPWRAIRDSAFLLAAGARTPRETQGAIQWALDRVDRHSDLLVPAPRYSAELLPGRVGYVRVPSFNGPATNATLADSLQEGLRRLDAGGACGWVVDLRWNPGGNVWPMLAGIGPLIGDSVAMISTVPEGRTWTMYRDGLSFERPARGADRPYTRVTVPPVTLLHPLAPVAVLIDSMTGSSGEAIALAFRGRPNARFFGTQSGGASTVNRTVRLSDGVEMLVTVGVMGDRTGRGDGGRLAPDELVPSPRDYLPRPSDAVAARGAEWVRAQAGCRE
jgi:C-terminal processing protease CtpA/Prc